ncbi:uncharacterized protein LOC129592091 [Paramacrobiotus metropolitanus]|uniref:uncharacterized protein LOC129592091 n=1 Tax=Paramacrobiotus metropolitanus TaxID=2943436 RepID=UPI002445B32C|nr:uncharacterized protein LOC129592091 [Paramacrobiotus metropolitanus]
MADYSNRTLSNSTIKCVEGSPDAGDPSGLNAIQIVTLTICFMAICSNLILLSLFCDRHVWQRSFGVYLIILAVGNIINSILQNGLILMVKNVLSPEDDSLFCSVHMTLRLIVTAYVPFIHVLICANRIWALVYPYSYRARHTFRLAISACVVAAIVIVGFVIPATVVDALHGRTPSLNEFCRMNFSNEDLVKWTYSFNIISLFIPESIILLTCPFLLRKRAIPLNRMRVTPSGMSPRGIKRSTDNDVIDGHDVSRNGSALRKHPRQNYRILALLTVSVFICWTPVNVYYVLPNLTSHTRFFQIANVVKLVHSAIDPVLFIASIDDLKEAYWRCTKKILCNRL